MMADTLQAAFQSVELTTPQMKRAIGDWFRMYYNQMPTQQEDPCQQIPYTVVRKLTKTVFAEYAARCENAFGTCVLEELEKIRARAMQLTLIGGMCLIKPVAEKDGFRFVTVDRRSVLIFGRDDQNRPTDIGTVEQFAEGRFYYTLLERRQVDGNGFLTVTNRLLRSASPDAPGQAVPLRTLKRYAELPECYTFPVPVGSVGMVCMQTPMVNCVDGSADAVSVYAAAAGLIRNIDRNEAQLCGEFRRGQSRLVVSADMLRRDENGRQILQDDLFVGLDEDPEAIGMTVFSPQLREQSYLARKQEYLRGVESVIGLKRGILSQVDAVERTAKEISSSEGDYSLTVLDFQQMWERALRETVQLCGVLGKLYRMGGAVELPAEQVTVCWGNGVLYDEERTGREMLAQVQAGLLQPERYLGWYYGLPCDTEEQRARIRREYMPDGDGV